MWLRMPGDLTCIGLSQYPEKNGIIARSCAA